MFTVRVAPVRLCSCSGENISLESPLPKWQRLCVNGGKRASELFLERASISDLSSTRSPPPTQPNHVTLACEVAYSKLSEVVTVAYVSDEDRVGNSF